jgi:hypothetical protein
MFSLYLAAFHFARNMILALGISVLVPMITYQTVILIQPRPEQIQNDSSEDNMQKSEEKALYNQAYAAYAKTYFCTATVASIVSIIIALVVSPPSINFGFTTASLICLTLGYWTYWNQLAALYRLIALFVALGFIVGLSGLFFRRKEM